MTPAGRSLDRERLESCLAGDPFVRRLVLRDRVASTNDILRELADEGAPAGTVVLAEEQTEGRGRMGSRWHSPPGCGLWMSLLVRPRRPVVELTRWTLGAAVAACETCREATGADVGIRWPNDLLWQGGKLGGVLAELRTAGGATGGLVIGTGLNVGQSLSDFPPEIASTATSLRIACGGRAPDREQLAAVYLRKLAGVLGALERGDWEAVAARWELLAPGAVGRGVRIVPRDGGDGYDGVTAGLDELGALRVRRADGRVTSVRLVESVRGGGDSRPGEA